MDQTWPIYGQKRLRGGRHRCRQAGLAEREGSDQQSLVHLVHFGLAVLIWFRVAGLSAAASAPVTAVFRTGAGGPGRKLGGKNLSAQG